MKVHRYTCATIALTFGLGQAALSAAESPVPAAANPAQYGFCFEHREPPATSYVSGTFATHWDTPEGDLKVVFGEFAKDTARRYGVAVATYDNNSGCTQQTGATAAEAFRKHIVAEYAKRGAVVETGWTFVRTADTPLPVYRGGGH